MNIVHVFVIIYQCKLKMFEVLFCVKYCKHGESKSRKLYGATLDCGTEAN